MNVENSKATALFRESAIKNLHSQDELHCVLKIITPTSWLWIVCAALLFLSILIWGMFGRIAVTVPAKGIILPDSQFQNAEQKLKENFTVRKERVIALKYLWDKKVALYKKHYLTIVDLNKAKEDYYLAKEEFDKIANVENLPFRDSIKKASKVSESSSNVLVFINHSSGKKISAGMAVYVLPSTLSVYEYGYIKGKVVGISEYPVSKQMVSAYLENMNWVDEFFIEGVPFIAKVRLETSSHTSSGLQWTTKDGPPYKIKPGTPVTIKIISKSCTPFQMLSKASLS